MNILFVCSKNKWRSRTAEVIFKNHPKHHVKSAGTDNGARIKVTKTLLEWADLILVMEDKHRQLLNQHFGIEALDDKLIVLDIADNYQFMNEELIEELKIAAALYLE